MEHWWVVDIYYCYYLSYSRNRSESIIIILIYILRRKLVILISLSFFASFTTEIVHSRFYNLLTISWKIYGIFFPPARYHFSRSQINCILINKTKHQESASNFQDILSRGFKRGLAQSTVNSFPTINPVLPHLNSSFFPPNPIIKNPLQFLSLDSPGLLEKPAAAPSSVDRPYYPGDLSLPRRSPSIYHPDSVSSMNGA